MGNITSRLKKWSKGEKTGPLIVQAHFTNKCNLSCDFCPTVALKEKEEIDYSEEISKEKWLEIIKESRELGVEEWHICGGGEPLFHKEKAIRLLKEIKNQNMRGELITNGTLLDKSASRDLLDIGWDLVTFSIDGPSKEINDEIRSEGSFVDAVKNAKILSEMRNGESPLLRIHTVLCNKNYDKIEEMVELTDNIGFDEIKFNSMNVWSKAGKKMKMNKDQKRSAKENMKKARKLAESRGIETNIKEFINHELLEHANEIDRAMQENTGTSKESKESFSDLSCYYPWYNMSIFSDGRTSPCFLFHEGDQIREKSLKEVWYGTHFQSIRDKFLDNNLKDVCKNCNAWNVEKMDEIRSELRKNES